jgi:dolichyl-phosphate-mannose-protein mannosyltransferase
MRTLLIAAHGRAARPRVTRAPGARKSLQRRTMRRPARGPGRGSRFALAVGGDASHLVRTRPSRAVARRLEPGIPARTHAAILALALATVLAFAFRASALSTYGFSEDELNKVSAIEQYRHGRFSANAEHPMLMKLAMWGSVDAAAGWNRIAPPALTLAPETALRLPNAIAGAATTIALFGVAELLFGGAVAGVVSLIWAFDVNAIAINRIGKEDTFLLFFFLLGVFCYERAKRTGLIDVMAARRWYTASGAAFGLMLASKYMPHYLGIYAVFNALTDRDPGANRPDPVRHFGAMAATFLITNPAIALPETWAYMARYVRGDMLAHHGYLYAGALYVTDVLVSPLGVPATFYLRLLGTKVPLVVLAALVPGVIEMVRRRRERGYILLRVLSVLLIVPYSLMAAKFLRYALPMFAIVDLVAAVGLAAGLGWLLRKQWLPAAVRVAVAAAAAFVFAAGLATAPLTAAPFYSLSQNAIGMRVDPARSAFPEQTYDYGVREAIDGIARLADPSAMVVTDAPAVAAYYLQRSDRADIAVRALSAHGTSHDARDTWVIVQNEHATFENQLAVEQLRARRRPAMDIRADELVAAQVFRIR